MTWPLWFWEWPQTITAVFRPEIVRDPDILVLAREDANEKRRLAAQLPAKVLAAIYGHLDRDPKAKNMPIARRVKRDPETGPLVAHLKTKTLADKIGALRSRSSPR